MAAEEPVFYHIWFGTKRRKWLLLGQIEEKVKELICSISQEKGITLISCETMVEHVHLLIKTGPGELPRVVKLLKGVSSRRILQAFPELRLDANTASFWQTRYGFKAVSPEAVNSTVKYISTQKERLEKFERVLYPRFKPGV